MLVNDVKNLLQELNAVCLCKMKATLCLYLPEQPIKFRISIHALRYIFGSFIVLLVVTSCKFKSKIPKYNRF